MTWTQNYDPFGSPILSTAVAALPIVVLLGLLAAGKTSAHFAAFLGLATALAAAIFGFVPREAVELGLAGRAQWCGTMLTAAGYGAAYGLFPIGWIVFSAIFLYTLTVDTGQFEIVKHSVVSLTDDRRLQALLIAFSFGAFVEGAAGFGTPVAISGALLLGAGFRPLHAAGLALLANTSPVAFGALGTPILMLANVTGIPAETLSAMAGRQLPFFSLIVPVWLVVVMAGFGAALEIWPALLVCGGSFALVQFLTANLHGPWLVDVAGGLVSLIATALFLRVWRPRRIWHFPEEPARTPTDAVPPTRRQIASAWVPWVLLTVFVFVWGLPQFKEFCEPTTGKIAVPGLHLVVEREPPIVPERTAEKAEYRCDFTTAAGTSIFLAAIVSAVWLGVRPWQFVRTLGSTLVRMRWPLVTIACMLAIAYVTRYSGMDATLGLAFTKTGWVYPLFAALLGWLGVALTGSDTSANALFGGLQTITATNLVNAGVLPLGVDQAKVLLASANSVGGVMGKMIDAQSIVVAAAATGQNDGEGPILRFVFWHSLALAVLMGLFVLAQAYWWSWMIPT